MDAIFVYTGIHKGFATFFSENSREYNCALYLLLNRVTSATDRCIIFNPNGEHNVDASVFMFENKNGEMSVIVTENLVRNIMTGVDTNYGVAAFNGGKFIYTEKPGLEVTIMELMDRTLIVRLQTVTQDKYNELRDNFVITGAQG